MSFDTAMSIAQFGWIVLVAVFGFAYRAYVARMSKVETAQEDLGKKHGSSVGALKDRMTKVEALLEHAPSKDDVHDLRLEVTKLCGDISVLNQGFENTSRGINRIETYIIKEVSE